MYLPKSTYKPEICLDLCVKEYINLIYVEMYLPKSI